MAPPKFLDTYLPYLLQRADHLMSAAFHSSLMGVGVQVSEWRVLAVLSEHGSLSVQEVANVALLPQPTASIADAGLRVTIGSEPENDLFLCAAAEVFGRRPQPVPSLERNPQ